MRPEEYPEGIARVIAAINPEHPEYWRARGVGFGVGTCLVTGETDVGGPDIAGFVSSREAGERVVALFGGRARLDYRDFEPNWIQVKVVVKEEHKDVMTRLMSASSCCEGMLSPRMILWALHPVELPGCEPRLLRYVRELATP